jgi:hypothetical protein
MPNQVMNSVAQQSMMNQLPTPPDESEQADE